MDDKIVDITRAAIEKVDANSGPGNTYTSNPVPISDVLAPHVITDAAKAAIAAYEQARPAVQGDGDDSDYQEWLKKKREYKEYEYWRDKNPSPDHVLSERVISNLISKLNCGSYEFSPGQVRNILKTAAWGHKVYKELAALPPKAGDDEVKPQDYPQLGLVFDKVEEVAYEHIQRLLGTQTTYKNEVIPRNEHARLAYIYGRLIAVAMKKALATKESK